MDHDHDGLRQSLDSFFFKQKLLPESIASTIFGYSKTGTRVISNDSIEIIMSLLNKILFLW